MCVCVCVRVCVYVGVYVCVYVYICKYDINNIILTYSLAFEQYLPRFICYSWKAIYEVDYATNYCITTVTRVTFK